MGPCGGGRSCSLGWFWFFLGAWGKREKKKGGAKYPKSKRRRHTKKGESRLRLLQTVNLEP